MLAVPILLALVQAAETADAIMARVAENQESAQAARLKYVYKQNIHLRLLRTNGKVSREERREYTVTPTQEGFKKDLTRFSGRYEKGGKYFEYSKPCFQYKDTDIDGDLIEDLANDLMNDKTSKDGISMDLFPLTKARQGELQFRLEETKDIKGRRVHRISFRPKDKDEFTWAGEATVDAAEYQPVQVSTRLARGIPWGVTVFLGTNLKQFGFALNYARLAEGVWFPVSYGTEFRIDVLWGYKRVITVSLENSDFRRTNVTSTLEYDSRNPP